MNPWNTLRSKDIGPHISNQVLQTMINEIDNALPFLRNYDCGSTLRAALQDRATLSEILLRRQTSPLDNQGPNPLPSHNDVG